MRRIDLNVSTFLVVLFALAALNLLSADKPQISATEQRPLRPRPAFSTKVLWSGQYFRDFEEHFGDTFFFREFFVRAGRRIADLRGLPTGVEAELVITRGDNGFAGFREAVDGQRAPSALAVAIQPEAAPGADLAPKPAANPAPAADPSEGLNARTAILLLPDRAMYVYRFSPESAQRYATALNRFRTQVPESVNMYALLAPTQIEFKNAAQYRELSSPQRPAIQYVYDHLAPGVKAVDAYSPLAGNTDQYLYFRTDHHWTALGAYYAYSAFARTTGAEPLPLDRFAVERISGFLGSTYAQTLSPRLEKQPDTLDIYRPPVATEYTIYYTPGTPTAVPMLNMGLAAGPQKYGVFLSGDAPLGRMTTATRNGRRIAVIKDSYANAFVPYLAAHYEEIFVIDPRTFAQSVFELVRTHQVNDVLFLNYVEVTGHDGYVDLLNQLFAR